VDKDYLHPPNGGNRLCPYLAVYIRGANDFLSRVEGAKTFGEVAQIIKREMGSGMMDADY